jgi:hypothetical protein
MRPLKLGILSDIHYAGAAEKARGNDYEYRDLQNPFQRQLVRLHRRHLWLRSPLDHNHLLDAFIEQNQTQDLIIANGDYSCDSAFIGLSDDAAFESARECLAKLRQAFGSRLRTVQGDHEFGKLSLVGRRGGSRMESYRRATQELHLDRFWTFKADRYLLMGVSSSLLALPANQAELLPEEVSDWDRLRAEHLVEIRQAFQELGAEARILLFCHDPTALPFLWEEPLVRSRVGQIEQTIIGHLHSPLIFKLSSWLSGMPQIHFLGHTARRLSMALGKAREWKPFNVRLCPSLAGIELLKDGGYYTAVVNAEGGTRAAFELHRLPRS